MQNNQTQEQSLPQRSLMDSMLLIGIGILSGFLLAVVLWCVAFYMQWL
jgi:hypothetical protein